MWLHPQPADRCYLFRVSDYLELTWHQPPLLAPWVVQSSHCCLDEELLWRENVWSCCRDHQLTAFPASSTLPWPPLPFHIGGGPPIGNINHCCACCLLWEQLKISKLVQLKALTCSGLADSAVVEIRLKPGQSSHDLHRPKCTYVQKHKRWHLLLIEALPKRN